MLIPEEWGGIGMSTVGFVAAMEQLGLADQSVAAAWQAHVTIGSLPLYLFGNDDAARALAATAGRGPGARRVRPDRARRRVGRPGHHAPGPSAEDGGWLINGRKTFISNAGTDMSFGVTLLARTPSDDGEPAYATLRRREGHARLHHGPEDAGHRLAGPRHPRAVLRRRVGARRPPGRRPRPGARPVPRARSRSGASRSPPCRSA